MTVLVIALLLAQAGPPAIVAPAAPPSPPASPAGGELAPADALLQQAAAEYDRGRHDDALRSLQRAYSLTPRPAILFDMAQVQRAQEDCGAALASYRRFIAATTPDDPDRPRAHRRELEMQACVGQLATPNAAATGAGPLKPTQAGLTAPGAQTKGDPGKKKEAFLDPSDPRARQAPSAAVVIDTAPATHRHPRMRAAAWGSLGVAALATAACAYLAWRASVDSDFSNLPYGSPGYQQRFDDGRSAQRWARWSGAAAILAGAGGGVLMVTSRASPAPASGRQVGAIAGWTWRF